MEQRVVYKFPDFRIKYLKFVETRPLLFSGISTAILCGVGLVGLLREINSILTSEMRVWLIGVLFRSVVRFLFRIYQAKVKLTIDPEIRQQVLLVDKCIDTIDVIGFVWFILGNVVVFEDMDCRLISPVVFYCSLFYLLLSYVNFILPYILRSTLDKWPPQSPEGIAYWAAYIAQRNRSRGIGRTDQGFTLINMAAPAGSAVSPPTSTEVTPEVAKYWSTWLESYGCFEVSYHPSMNIGHKHESSYHKGNTNANATDAESKVNGDVGVFVVAALPAGHVKTSSSESSPTTSSFLSNRVAPAETVDLESGSYCNTGVNKGYALLPTPAEVDTTSALQYNNRNKYISIPTNSDVQRTSDEEVVDGIGIGNSAELHARESESEGEGEFCSVCLRPFVAKEINEERAGALTLPLPICSDNGHIIEGSYNDHTGENGAVLLAGERAAPTVGELSEHNLTANAKKKDTGAGAGGDETSSTNSSNKSGKLDHIVVRDPCEGSHYFHAHCLHGWLQVGAVRYQNMRRFGVAAAAVVEDPRLHVTCPCCREHPATRYLVNGSGVSGNNAV